MTVVAAAVILGLIAAGWVIFPIVLQRLALVGDPIAGGVIDAEARKRVALQSLREIEYDRIGGKLDETDYQRLKAQLEQEALLAIRAAEGAQLVASGAPPSFRITHSCGFVNPPGSRFCSGCGKKLG
ncbi:MAG TPA: hypothetical protein VFL93_10445 [Longimicrobiaceae bacterium]|nr:hypothetical protein [Longimicrobiaceae bacterium]